MLKNCKTFFENKHFYSALSVVAITSATGAKEQEMSYDAWGRRRNPANWSYDGLPDSTTYLINRGYTFHQHYDKLGLINMNGRVYDPIVGRFLSVDPLVGNPLSAQDYNGYSYCANNPMKYTDPSGYTYWQYKDGEWSHFEYHPFQNGSANFREASNGGVAYYGAPMTYRYAAGQYRDEKGNVVSYKAVHKNYVAPNSAKVESYSALLGYLADGFSFRYETAGNYWGYVAVDDGKSIGVLAFSKFNGNNGPIMQEDDGFVKTAETIAMVTNVADIVISAAEQTIQTTQAGANFAYFISGSSKLINVVSNTIKYAPYVGLTVSGSTGYYLSTEIDPATGRPYQSWAETGTDMGVNIATMYVGTQYGGWYGAGAAAFYIGVKTNVRYQMNIGINPGMIFIMNKE